jgi:hypothetical protein
VLRRRGYHAVFTDSPFELVQAEGQHRDHAIVEQVFADWTGGPLAHLPYVRSLPCQRGLADPLRVHPSRSADADVLRCQAVQASPPSRYPARCVSS